MRIQKTLPVMIALMLWALPAAQAAPDRLEKRQTIDGYTVTFRVTRAKEGEEMGGSHNVMVKVEQDGKALTGIPVNSKVVYPDGKGETKMMMGMGDWYMAGYDLGQAGRHELMILFKTADRVKHKGGIYYPND